ncbi:MULTISPECIES: FecR domain-containing protein [unclassified Shinella]|uniref:FecR family protein n=1 Tax=unclassified Shinella TaxID=2643062 RepID=UPI00234EBF59|nr:MULTISPECIES: FecR domain-containing protein [unclassified Shinella]MCO5140160.1 FecR domain-containing protein [Shinella sp.]MDC7256822.1 FecR domain-containing protein [Shinella sp. YE25]CAK7258098.1 transmembrane sensor [Shinella sp. WSC3-e]
MVQENQPGLQTEREAIAWFTRMNGKPSRADRQHFEDWRKIPAHAAAYDRVSSVWSSAGGIGTSLGREDRSAIAAHLSRIEELRRRRKSAKTGAAVLTVLLALGASGWLWLEKPHLLQDMRADYVAARGERRSITLSDGSTMLLDADSAVAVDVTDKERRIDLLRGTAYFEVQPSSVPFIVDAANGRSRVLGTAFDVSVTEEGAHVTLARGSLQVSLVDGPESVVLKPGESVAYGGEGLGTPGAVEISEAMAWREGRFVFNNMRLADVLAQIERNRDGRIVLIGNALADRRVSGSLVLADTDAALEAVQSIAGFRMQKLGGRLVVIRQ